jgi:DNA-directed RNA polymerases I, II, and III subunit RPABC3
VPPDYSSLPEIHPAATMSDSVKFDETFSITSINNEKYDRVSRVYGTSSDSSTTFSLDINHELFPLSTGDNVTVCLADTLSLDGSTEDMKGWRAVAQGESTLADMYEYVCHGKVYKFEDGGDGSTMWVRDSSVSDLRADL